MRLRWAACAVVALGILATTAPVDAQGLNEVLGRLLSNSCQGLNGPSSTAYGPDLIGFCQGGGGAAAATGGTAGGEVRNGGEEQRSVYRRLRERQGAASADTGGARGFSLFASADYQKFDKDTTRFEAGFERDTVGGTIGADFMFRNGLILGDRRSPTATSSATTRASAAASTTTPTGSSSTSASRRSPTCSSTPWPATRAGTTASSDASASPTPSTAPPVPPAATPTATSSSSASMPVTTSCSAPSPSGPASVSCIARRRSTDTASRAARGWSCGTTTRTSSR